MKIDLDLVQLPNTESLFLSGKNFGSKIAPGQKNITELSFDTETGLAKVVCEGQMALIRGFMSVTVKRQGIELKPKPTPEYANVPVKAQVGGPGDVRRKAQVETPIDKVQGIPGKRAKYQGGEVND